MIRVESCKDKQLFKSSDYDDTIFSGQINLRWCGHLNLVPNYNLRPLSLISVIQVSH